MSTTTPDVTAQAVAQNGGADRVARAFAGALLGGDPSGAASHFEPGALLLTADGTQVCGHRAITEVLEQITSSQMRLRIHLGRTLEAGSTALATQLWHRSGTGFKQTTTTSLVLGRRGGTWAILIASPWG